jgi:hypothetical protein
MVRCAGIYSYGSIVKTDCGIDEPRLFHHPAWPKAVERRKMYPVSGMRQSGQGGVFMSEGWIRLHRGWRDNTIFKGDFSSSDAWVWMIENACWQDTRVRIKGETIKLHRGELSFSVRFMAEKWGWSKSRVDRFMAVLRQESMIETRSKIGTASDHKAGQGQSIISICNYAKYQDIKNNTRDNSGTKNGTTAGQQRDKEEQYNKERIDILDKSNISKRARKPDFFVKPDWADQDVWDDFMVNRKKAKNTATAYKGFLSDIAKHSCDEWPPWRLLEYAVQKGWMAIYPPKNESGANGNRTGQPIDKRDGIAIINDRRRERLDREAGIGPAPVASAIDGYHAGDGEGDSHSPLATIRAVR